MVSFKLVDRITSCMTKLYNNDLLGSKIDYLQVEGKFFYIVTIILSQWQLLARSIDLNNILVSRVLINEN